MTKQVCREALDEVFDETTVEVVGTQRYHGSLEVAKYICHLCKRPGLVQMQTAIDSSNEIDLAHELRRAGFCDKAISVAPLNISASAVLSGTNSVVQ